MSERLKDFLVDLASDPDRLRRFVEDSSAELDRSGLSADEKAAIASHNATRLRAALGQLDNDTMTQIGAGGKPYKKPGKPSKSKPKKRPGSRRKPGKKR